MTRSALKLADPPLPPGRGALALAIAEAAPLRAAVDKARNAAEKARGALASALAAVPAAERAAVEARTRAVEDPGADRAELRAARSAVVDATDDLAIARDVSERAEVVLTEAEGALRYAVERIDTAASAVVLTAYEAAIAEAERVGREFARLAFVAREIGQQGNPWNGEQSRLVGRVETLNAHWAYRGDGQAVSDAIEAAVAPWRAARVALLSDPSAPLPSVP